MTREDEELQQGHPLISNVSKCVRRRGRQTQHNWRRNYGHQIKRTKEGNKISPFSFKLTARRFETKTGAKFAYTLQIKQVNTGWSVGSVCFPNYMLPAPTRADRVAILKTIRRLFLQVLYLPHSNQWLGTIAQSTEPSGIDFFPWGLDGSLQHTYDDSLKFWCKKKFSSCTLNQINLFFFLRIYFNKG